MKSIITTLTLTVFFSLNLIAQPLNDHIQDATDLMVQQLPVPFEDNDVDFAAATFPGDATQGQCGIGAAGIWYKFTPTKNGTVTAEIMSPAQPIAVFFVGPTPNANSGAELSYVDQVTNPCDNSNISSINAIAGLHYYIFMKNDIMSNIEINIFDALLAPENDLIADATSLNGFEDFVDPDVHFLATTINGDMGGVGCPAAVPGIWYKFTAEIDGQVIAGLSTVDNQSALIFYEAPDENVTDATELTHVVQPSNPCGASNLTSIDAEAGKTYYLLAATIEAYGTVSINLSAILGNSDTQLQGFSYYPNPVSNELNLQAQNNIEEVSLYSITGNRIFFDKPGNPRLVMNLSSLSAGIYVMQVTSEGKTASYKIIKN